MTAPPWADAPTRTTILHIGLSRAPAAFVEAALGANPELLAAAGVDYLGRGSRELRSALRAQGRNPTTLASAGARVAERVVQSPHDVVLLSVSSARRASPEEIATLVGALGEVHVVVTVATVEDDAIATWRDAVVNGGRVSLEEFVQDLAEPSEGSTSPPGLAADLPEVVRTWSTVLGQDAVTVVTLPPGEPGPGHWAAFAAAAGSPVSQIRLDGASDSGPELSFSDLELLRRLNDEVLRRMTKEEYDRVVRDFLVPEIATLSSADEADTLERPSLTPSHQAWALAQTERRSAMVADVGVQVVTTAGSASSPDEPAEGRAGRPRLEYPDAAIRAMRKLIFKIAAVEGGSGGVTRRRQRQRSGGSA